MILYLSLVCTRYAACIMCHVPMLISDSIMHVYDFHIIITIRHFFIHHIVYILILADSQTA